MSSVTPSPRNARLPGSAVTYVNDLERNLHQLGQTLGVNPEVWSTTPATAPI